MPRAICCSPPSTPWLIAARRSTSLRKWAAPGGVSEQCLLVFSDDAESIYASELRLAGYLRREMRASLVTRYESQGAEPQDAQQAASLATVRRYSNGLGYYAE